ncbi:MAG: YCF48-related protein [Planctomycetota bacterium]|nr:YCF48-related protein [Planctomycetota bacterium]
MASNRYRIVWVGLMVLLLESLAGVSRAEEFWKIVATGTEASLRGLSPVNRSTAWACGSQSTLVRTIDGGQTWTRHTIEGLKGTELRSIHAWSADELVVATAGSPCRIYKTANAGQSWDLVYENQNPQAFIDGLRFGDDEQGFAFGDPIDSKLMALRSDDRGRTWARPAAEDFRLKEGEAGFAASNSSLLVFRPKTDRSKTRGSLSVWIGLGGASGPAQILISSDAGASWTRSGIAMIPSGKSAGIFSIAMSPEGRAVAVGGDYMEPDSNRGNIAIYDSDTGVWQAAEGQVPRGFRSSVVFLPEALSIDHPRASWIRWICAGPSGCDFSEDGKTWYALSEQPFHSLAVASDKSLWACGPEGRVGMRKEAP